MKGQGGLPYSRPPRGVQKKQLQKLRKLAGHLQITSIGSKATRKQVVAAIHAIVSGSGQSADAELEDDMPIGDSDNCHDDAGA